MSKIIFLRRLSTVLLFQLYGFYAFTQPDPGKGADRAVESAYTLSAGDFVFSPFATTYFTRTQSNTNIYDIAAGLNFQAGLGKRFGLRLSSTIYQDTNTGTEPVSLPHNIYFSLKWLVKSFESTSNAFAFKLATNLPLSKTQNIPLQRYYSARVSAGLNTIFTQAFRRFLPETASKININAGYWFHNDKGQRSEAGSGMLHTVNQSSHELLFGAGSILNYKNVKLGIAWFGSYFLRAPAADAYARESFSYVSPGVSIRLQEWLSLSMRADFRVSEGEDATDYRLVPPVGDETALNYASYRIRAGISIRLSPAPRWRKMQRVDAAPAPERRKSKLNSLARKMEGATTGAENAHHSVYEAADENARKFLMWQFKHEGNPVHFFTFTADRKKALNVRWFSKKFVRSAQVEWKLIFKGIMVSQGTAPTRNDQILSLKIPIESHYPAGTYELAVRPVTTGKSEAWGRVVFSIERDSRLFY